MTGILNFRIWGKLSFPTTGFSSKCATSAQFLFLQKHWQKSRTRLNQICVPYRMNRCERRELRETSQFSEKGQWIVSEQNYDICYSLITIRRYVDHGLRVKSLEPNWLRNLPWQRGGNYIILIVGVLRCTIQSIENRQGWQQQQKEKRHSSKMWTNEEVL